MPLLCGRDLSVDRILRWQWGQEGNLYSYPVQGPRNKHIGEKTQLLPHVNRKEDRSGWWKKVRLVKMPSIYSVLKLSSSKKLWVSQLGLVMEQQNNQPWNCFTFQRSIPVASLSIFIFFFPSSCPTMLPPLFSSSLPSSLPQLASLFLSGSWKLPLKKMARVAPSSLLRVSHAASNLN